MKNYDYGYGFKPISAWGYVGYSLLWSIPVVGWIIWLCQAIGASNRNVRNYARSYLCKLILSIALCALAVGVLVILHATDILPIDAVIRAIESGTSDIFATLK